MAKSTSTPVNVPQLVRTLDGYGRRYSDARNALVAHLVATGVKQTDIVTETGLDKGDVSRIAKVVNNNATAKSSAKRISLGGLDPESPSTLSKVAKVGETYFRRAKVQRVSDGPADPVALAEGDTSTVEVPPNTATVSVETLVKEWIAASPDTATLVNRSEVLKGAISAAYRTRAEALAKEAEKAAA